jgi:hypothetical protein
MTNADPVNTDANADADADEADFGPIFVFDLLRVQPAAPLLSPQPARRKTAKPQRAADQAQATTTSNTAITTTITDAGQAVVSIIGRRTT